MEDGPLLIGGIGPVESAPLIQFGRVVVGRCPCIQRVVAESNQL
jgi:hypothetical protein